MGDKSIAVQNFRWGLESRRSELITQAGALASITDGHINAGGEIEQRAGFFAFANLTIADSLGDTGVFGAEATDAGITVFGSALAFGSSVTFSQPTLASAMPSTSPVIVYQQLQHPEIYDQRVLTSDLVTAVSYDRTKHRMTALVFSANFEGKAVALATFADGNTFLYFNGALVAQSRDGRVTANQKSLSALSKDAARQVRDLANWTSQPNNNQSSPTNTDLGATGVFSPAGVHYTLAASRTCAGDGQIGVFDSLSVDQPGTIGTAASVKFTFSGFANTTGRVTVTAPTSNVVSTIITVIDYTPSSNRTPAQLATDITTLINRLTSNLGYFASTDGAGAFTMFAPAAWGDFQGNVVVTSADAGVTVTAAAGATSGSLSVVVASVSKVDMVNGNARQKLVTINATAHPTGGTGNYTKFTFSDVFLSAAKYDGGGAVTYSNLVIGATYSWQKGANDTSITCGGTTLTATGTFVASATTAAGVGTANTVVTAVTLNANPVVNVAPAFTGLGTSQGQTVTFSKLLSVNQSVQGFFQCFVVDSTPAYASCNFSVYLELDSNA